MILFKRILHFIKWICIVFLIASLGIVLLFRFVPVPFTWLMLQRCVEQKMNGKDLKLKKDWIGYNELPNNLQLAVVCAEDQNFLYHSGFDFEAIDKAVKYNEKQHLKRHPKTRGASTISQQTAKNVFLFPARSFIRKGFEVYFTFLIELFYSKERIMQCYLNVIEMGDGIYGAEAASQFYFHKSAIAISNREAAMLAAILPNPRKWNPIKPTAYLIKRQNWILEQMNNFGGKLEYVK